jgi:hypothetical protein
MVSANLIYELPFRKNKRFASGSSVVNYIIAIGRSIPSSLHAPARPSTSLLPVTSPTSGNAGTYERADLVGDSSRTGAVNANPACSAPAAPTRTCNQWFNPCAFKTPVIGPLGDAPRNFIRGPQFWNVDAALHRILPIHENLALKLYIEAFTPLATRFSVTLHQCHHTFRARHIRR